MSKSRYVPCPCDSKTLYHKCCRRFHDGSAPENALLLMRSRYCAYALGLVDYIMATTHPENPSYTSAQDEWRRDLLAFCQSTSFDGLEIDEFVDGDTTATVTFTAYLKQGAHDATFSEKSLFSKTDGRWLYKSGEIA